MKKSILLLLTVFLTSMHLYGQNELDLNKNIYKTADSLKAIGQMGSIDTPSLFEQAPKLDNKHPSEFFNASGDYMVQTKWNEAAFVYDLGLMRFRYYNSANPNYQAGADGALLGALS